MKRNKLTLIAGVLLVVATILCVFAIYYYALGVYELFPILYEETEVISHSYILNIVITYIASIVLKVAQIIVFLILGIKLIIKGIRKVPVNKCKGLVISAMVIAYWSALMEIGTYHTFAIVIFGLFLTAGILLSCALSKKDKVADFGGESSTFNKKVSTNSKVDEVMIDRVKIIKSLKDDGMLSEDQYFELMKQVIGFDIPKDIENEYTMKSKEEENEGK